METTLCSDGFETKTNDGSTHRCGASICKPNVSPITCTWLLILQVLAEGFSPHMNSMTLSLVGFLILSRNWSSSRSHCERQHSLGILRSPLSHFKSGVPYGLRCRTWSVDSEYMPTRRHNFGAVANLVGKNSRVRLFLKVSMRIERSSRHDSYSDPISDITGQTPRYLNDYSVHLQTVEVRHDMPINSLESGPLDLSEIGIEFGPAENSSRRTIVHGQFPTLVDVTVSGHSTSQQWSLTAGGGYNQTIASATATRGSNVDHPSTSIGLDIRKIKIGVSDRNLFYWRYPISKSRPEFKQSAVFTNHRGRISYSPEEISSAIRAKLVKKSTHDDHPS